jgi:hypothetical protein
MIALFKQGRLFWLWIEVRTKDQVLDRRDWLSNLEVLEGDIYSYPMFEKLFTLEESWKGGGEWYLGKESANPSMEVEVGAVTQSNPRSPNPFPLRYGPGSELNLLFYTSLATFHLYLHFHRDNNS